MRGILFSAVGLGLILVPTRGLAQTDLERATAREAANTGRAQFEAGRYADAIDSFSRAQQLVSAPPHLLYLARAQAKLGRLVEAHENYLKITRETLPPKAPKAFLDAQSAAEHELEAVDARLPSVTIAVQGVSTKDLSVRMDGTPLSAAMVGIPLPVNPGQHVFEAQGTSANSAPVTVTVAEGGKETVMLTLRAVSAPPPERRPGSASSTLTSDPLDSGKASSGGTGLRVASYIAFGVGAIGLGVGTYFMTKYSSASSESNRLFDACNPGCLPSQEAAILSKDDDANSQRKLGIGAFVVGGVGALTGVTLLIVSASGNSTPAQGSAPRVTPMFGVGSLGLAGRF